MESIIDLSINNVYTNYMKTKIKKRGNSQGIRISKELLEMCNLDLDDNVSLSINEKNEIIISKVEETIAFSTLFSNWNGKTYNDGEFDWGDDDNPRGKEIW